MNSPFVSTRRRLVEVAPSLPMRATAPARAPAIPLDVAPARLAVAIAVASLARFLVGGRTVFQVSLNTISPTLTSAGSRPMRPRRTESPAAPPGPSEPARSRLAPRSGSSGDHPLAAEQRRR